MTQNPQTNLSELCRTILLGPTLDDKLTFSDDIIFEECETFDVIVPARAKEIALSSKSERLPKLNQLADPNARAMCLARFAHHELLAIEMLAWALLAIPNIPPALKRGLLITLQEEQTHLSLYLKRLEALGTSLSNFELSDYLWRQIENIREAKEPLAAFLCSVGLTLEQANLDFTILYRDAFRRFDDEESAQVLQRVHDDEIGHVRMAAVWMRKLYGDDLWHLYNEHVPFPLSAVRAKARRFERGARRKAGLDDVFIDAVQSARPTYQK